MKYLIWEGEGGGCLGVLLHVNQLVVDLALAQALADSNL